MPKVPVLIHCRVTYIYLDAGASVSWAAWVGTHADACNLTGAIHICWSNMTERSRREKEPGEQPAKRSNEHNPSMRHSYFLERKPPPRPISFNALRPIRYRPVCAYPFSPLSLFSFIFLERKMVASLSRYMPAFSFCDSLLAVSLLTALLRLFDSSALLFSSSFATLFLN